MPWGYFSEAGKRSLKGANWLHLGSCSFLGISFTTVQDSWTQQRQEYAARTSRLVWWAPIRGLSRLQSDYAAKNEWAVPDPMLFDETKRAKMLFRILNNWGIGSRTGLVFHQICFELWNSLQSPLILCYWKIPFGAFNFFPMIVNSNKVTLESYLIIHILVKRRENTMI